MTVSSTPPAAPSSRHSACHSQSTCLEQRYFPDSSLIPISIWQLIGCLYLSMYKMCTQACFWGCASGCQLHQRVYVSRATCLSCSPLFPIPKVCLSIKRQGLREGGGCLAEGGQQWGVLRCARTLFLSAGERYEKWDDCSSDDGGGGGGSPDNRRELSGRVWWWRWWRSWGGGAAEVEKYNFSSSIAMSVITACHA